VTIEPGQLRRWRTGFTSDYSDATFLVLDYVRTGQLRRWRCWRILIDGEICDGWTDALLDELSEALDG